MRFREQLVVNAIAPGLRFREARERLGLTPDEVAQRSRVSASVWHIEAYDGDLTACHSPKDIQRFCRILGIRPAELFGADTSAVPVPAEELIRLIHEQCRSRGITLKQFEDAVGWKLAGSIEPPDRLLEDMTIGGLQWLCRELGIDWHRVILSL